MNIIVRKKSVMKTDVPNLWAHLITDSSNSEPPTIISFSCSFPFTPIALNNTQNILKTINME